MNPWARFLVGLVAIALIVLPMVAVLQGWIGMQRFAFHHLQVQGALTQEEAAELRSVLAPQLKRGFFATRLGDVRGTVEALAWVAHAEVRKSWPDVLEVVVEEQRPFAYWNDAQLVSTRGIVYPRESRMELPAGMPHLHGDDRNVGEVLSLYARANEAFAPGGDAVVALGQDARGSWDGTLSSGLRLVIGRTEPASRIARFARLLPALRARENGRLPLYADLRYTNGFALKWRANSVEPAPTEPMRHEPRPAPGLPAPLPEPITTRLPLRTPAGFPSTPVFPAQSA